MKECRSIVSAAKKEGIDIQMPPVPMMTSDGHGRLTANIIYSVYPKPKEVDERKPLFDGDLLYKAYSKFEAEQSDIAAATALDLFEFLTDQKLIHYVDSKRD